MRALVAHSNQVGGVTVLGDNTKIYWSEGYSDTIIVYPDGRRETLPYSDMSTHPLSDDIMATEFDDTRMMTESEEAEWVEIRCGC